MGDLPFWDGAPATEGGETTLGCLGINDPIAHPNDQLSAHREVIKIESSSELKHVLWGIETHVKQV